MAVFRHTAFQLVDICLSSLRMRGQLIRLWKRCWQGPAQQEYQWNQNHSNQSEIPPQCGYGGPGQNLCAGQFSHAQGGDPPRG